MTDSATERAAMITQDVAVARFRAALRLKVGLQKPYSVDMLAAETGVGARTLRGYADGENAPTLVNLLRIMAVLPPDFADAVLDLAGLAGVRRIEGEKPRAGHVLHDILRRGEQLAHALAARGEIDHQHRRALIPSLRALAAELDAFIAGLEAME